LPFSDTDKIFWFRAVLGLVGGAMSELITGCKVILTGSSAGSCVGGAMPDYTTGVLIAMMLFIASYYFLRATFGSKFPKEQQGKIYTTGIGTYAMLFVFSWILLFTLGVTYLNL
jgi:hypothetical protein